jgi:hypothetical protein
MVIIMKDGSEFAGHKGAMSAGQPSDFIEKKRIWHHLTARRNDGLRDRRVARTYSGFFFLVHCADLHQQKKAKTKISVRIAG